MTRVPGGAPAGLRAVAALEAGKGALVLLAGLGAFALIHRDVQEVADRLVLHLHLNPAHHLPGVFLAAAGRVTDARLRLLAAGALVYAAVRFVESWGLWRQRAWAEWLGALSGGVYVPYELATLAVRPTPLKAAALLVNLAVVVYLVRLLRDGRRGA